MDHVSQPSLKLSGSRGDYTVAAILFRIVGLVVFAVPANSLMMAHTSRDHWLKLRLILP
jgi:hypothetical protein